MRWGKRSTTTSHPLLTRLQDAARGQESDVVGRGAREIEVGPALPGPCDAVTFLPGRAVVAADLDEAWVREALAPWRDHPAQDPTTGAARFLAAAAERLGGPATSASVLTAAPYRAAFLRGTFTTTGAPDPGWAPYRTEVTSYRYDSPGAAGTIDLGRGPAGRWDVFLRVDGDTGSGGASRQLLTAALTLIPKGEELYAAAPLHDVPALRAVLAGGFRPIATEVLFLTRPR